MQLGISGNGEANAGAWMIFFAVLPLAQASDAMGLKIGVLESPAATFSAVAVQTLVLILVGALIDLAMWCARPRR